MTWFLPVFYLLIYKQLLLCSNWKTTFVSLRKKGGWVGRFMEKRDFVTSERFFSVDIYLPVVLLPQAPSLKNKWHRSPCNPYNHLIFYKVMRTAVIISKEETVYYTPNHVTKKYLLSEILTPSSSGFFFDIKITQCQGWIKMT